MWGIDAAGFMALTITVATLVVLEGSPSAPITRWCSP